MFGAFKIAKQKFEIFNIYEGELFMRKELKLRVTQEEYDLLGRLAEAIEEETRIRQTRTGVAYACLRHGTEVMRCSVAESQQTPA